MANTVKNIFAISLSIILLSQGLFGLTGKYFDNKTQLLSAFISSIQLVIFNQSADDQDIPPVETSNSGDFDKEELEEEKENVYIRYGEDTFEVHYTSISMRSLIFNDAFISTDPLEVIVPPPDLNV